MSMSTITNLSESIQVLRELGFPRAQLNDRSAFCLLALLNLSPNKHWIDAEAPMMGVTPIMQWIQTHYGKAYAPNTRETFRRQTIHQFLAAGLLVQNPDDPQRPVNSPATVYQLEPTALQLLRTWGTALWPERLAVYLQVRPSLADRYAAERRATRKPITIAMGGELTLSPGKHSELIKAVLEEFAPRFALDAALIYVGDTASKWAFIDNDLLSALDLRLDLHGKMPDVILYDPTRNRLFLVEAVTSHGPMDGKRYDELTAMFSATSSHLIFVTAFPDRRTMARYLSVIAWETEVWVAESPSHLIHFNGDKFLDS